MQVARGNRGADYLTPVAASGEVLGAEPLVERTCASD